MSRRPTVWGVGGSLRVQKPESGSTSEYVTKSQREGGGSARGGTGLCGFGRV